jgi:hypothetical protein
LRSLSRRFNAQTIDAAPPRPTAFSCYVACADNRVIKDHRCEKPVGTTVDVKTATYNNSIGDMMPSAYWQDPDFDSRYSAFY